MSADLQQRLDEIRDEAIVILAIYLTLSQSNLQTDPSIDLWRSLAASARMIERRAARTYREGK